MQGIRLQRAPNFLWIYAGTTGEGGQVKGVRVLLFKPFKVWSFDICIEGFSCTFSQSFELYATWEKTTLEEEQSNAHQLDVNFFKSMEMDLNTDHQAQVNAALE